MLGKHERVGLKIKSKMHQDATNSGQLKNDKIKGVGWYTNGQEETAERERVIKYLCNFYINLLREMRVKISQLRKTGYLPIVYNIYITSKK